MQRAADALFEQRNENKNYKQKLEEKEFMLSLSPLNQNRIFLLLDPNNRAEYWQYFCSYDEELRRNDGLVYFIRDFYRAAAYKVDEWSQDLIDLTCQLKDTLLVIIDRLDRLKESYLDDLVDVDNAQFALDEALLAIPDLSKRRTQAAAPADPDLSEDDEGPQRDDGEEFGPEVEERLLRICRDNIISRNVSIRGIFKIESKASDILVNPYFMKKTMKDVCGMDVSFREISWFINKSMKVMVKKLQMRGVLGQEIGMPGYVRARYQTMML